MSRPIEEIEADIETLYARMKENDRDWYRLQAELKQAKKEAGR
jgi:peptidoglycan hydrolase CwlO-like protein